MHMFQNILVVFVTSTHTGHTSDIAFEIAKKFDSKITFLKCIEKPIPKFGFFHSKGEKKEHQKDLEDAKKSVHALEENGKKLNVTVDSKVESIESFTDFLIPYIQSNKIDLLIVDSHSLDEIHHENHKEMINTIFTTVSCPLLTLR